jgi:bacterioferritin-associated ferredoxin
MRLDSRAVDNPRQPHIIRIVLIRFLHTYRAMYVCICNGITDREIRGAVSLGARTLDDLTTMMGVAGCCGRCADCARGILAECPYEPAHHGAGDD